MDYKVLIVDDEPDICEILEFNLKNEGLNVTSAHSAEEGLEKLDDNCNLILLDVMMDGMSGYKMAEKLRAAKNLIPIIFLTAKRSENDMLTGFSVGGDDYIIKPFSIKEVIARVKAILKREALKSELKQDSDKTTEIINLGTLKLNKTNKEAYIDEQLIALTKTEFELLQHLMSNMNQLFSREELINTVWKDNTYITERTVDVHITRLRKKIGEYGKCITSRSGYGYQFCYQEE